MLAPETRALMTDALRPPDGFRVDVAVATSYSLDLTSLLLAPMAFALHEYDSREPEAVDPIRVVESIRRHNEHTTVFCQAGAIYLPASYRTAMTFAEDSVYEVTAPTAGRVFHPKIWLARFADEQGRCVHRFLCLSRNLTFDRSWDTLLRLDEEPDQRAGSGPDTEPLARFIESLPGLAVRDLPRARLAQLQDLASTVRRARFTLPEGFDRAEFLPLGIDGRVMPELGAGDQLLAVSAFLDAATVRSLDVDRR